MPLPEEDELPELNPEFGDESEQKQRRQMLIALALLLVALILVLVKDRDFWFPPAPAAESASEPVEQITPEAQTPSQVQPSAGTAKPSAPERSRSKPRTPPPVAATPSPAPALAPVVTSRTVLPPLEVEVVAGDEHRTIQAGTNSVKVDLQPRTPVTASQSSSDSGGVADATGRVHLSPGAAQIISRPVEPNYPLLAKQMKVQGAVVLEALIGQGWQYSGFAHIERTHDSLGGRARSREAVALQALPAIGRGCRNRGSNHGELYHLDSVIESCSEHSSSMAFAISSASFPNGGDIPKKFTCDGADVSPELSWTDPPPGTQKLCLDRRRSRCARRNLDALGAVRPAANHQQSGGRREQDR